MKIRFFKLDADNGVILCPACKEEHIICLGDLDSFETEKDYEYPTLARWVQYSSDCVFTLRLGVIYYGHESLHKYAFQSMYLPWLPMKYQSK